MIKLSVYLAGIEFDLKGEDPNEVYTGTTDSNGEIIFKNLYQGKYTLIERKTQEEYQLNQTPFTINVEYNKQSTITVENEKIKGSIRVVKQDLENPEVKLANVKFELYDEDLNLLEILETDENGEAVSSEYPSVGKQYYLKEIETKEEYNLNEKMIQIELEDNVQKEIVVENKLKKGWVRIIKQDLENTGVRLMGVQFELYDEEMNLLETLETDEKGEAISQEYPSTNKKYYLKEIKTIDGYVLDKELKEITLADNAILDVFIKNAKTPKEPEIITITKEVEPKVITIIKEAEPKVIIEEIEPEPIIEKVIIGEPKVVKEVIKLPRTGM